MRVRQRSQFHSIFQTFMLQRPKMRSLAFASLLLSAAVAQKTQVSTTVYDQLARYARFASASYSSNCANPPFGSTVEKMFNDQKTDTQVTLFRDESAQEYILSFRGTSSVQDFVTDLQQDLVSCSAADGISCLGCTVSLLRCQTFCSLLSLTKPIAVRSGLPRAICLCPRRYRHHFDIKPRFEPRLQARGDWSQYGRGSSLLGRCFT